MNKAICLIKYLKARVFYPLKNKKERKTRVVLIASNVKV